MKKSARRQIVSIMADLNRRSLQECILFLASFLLPVIVHAGQAQTEAPVGKGQYIFALAGGCACHTVPKGTLHAGGRAFPIPMGTVYSTNITQDKETGL